MDYLDNDIPRYKKKSKTKSSKKSDHQHNFIPCIAEFPEEWFLKPHLRNGNCKRVPRLYCPLCGKLKCADDDWVLQFDTPIFSIEDPFVKQIFGGE